MLMEMNLPQCLGYALGMRQAHLKHQPISEITSTQTEFLFPPIGVEIHICCKEKAYYSRMVLWSTSNMGICAEGMHQRILDKEFRDMRLVCGTAVRHLTSLRSPPFKNHHKGPHVLIWCFRTERVQ